MAALYYHHSTRKPLTNSLSVRAAGLLTGYSRDAEDQASGSAELDYPSPAEVSGSTQGCQSTSYPRMHAVSYGSEGTVDIPAEQLHFDPRGAECPVRS